MGRSLRHGSVLTCASAVAWAFASALSAGCGREASAPAVTAPATSSAPASPATGSAAPGAVPRDGGGAPSSELATDGGASALVRTVFVSETRVDCVGEGARRCLQVRESESAPWTLFYDRIQGFAYEEGTRYELRVALESNPNPPADAPSLRYRLVEIVSKQKITPPGKGR